MGILDRLRVWLDGLRGGSEPAAADTEPDGLDPDNVTEVRSDADDDAVEKLQSIREEGDDAE